MKLSMSGLQVDHIFVPDEICRWENWILKFRSKHWLMENLMSQCKIDVMKENQEPIYENVSIPRPNLVLLNIILWLIDQVWGRIKEKLKISIRLRYKISGGILNSLWFSPSINYFC